MRIVITYNLKKRIKEKNKPIDYYSEFDSYKTVCAISGALREKGHQVKLVQANEALLDYLLKHRRQIDFVFNIAEGSGGSSREAQVPAILDLIGLPYTGSGVLALALALDKAMAKKIFQFEGIPTPKFQVFYTGQEPLRPDLEFPLIVKPNREGSAKGIFSFSVVREEKRLYQLIKQTIKEYKQEVLVEEFIEGKELTVGIIGNGRLQVLPILEIDFSSCPSEFFYSWRMKEFQGSSLRRLNPSFFCPARIEQNIEREIEGVALKAHRALGCLDISRIDIRLGRNGAPYVLEVNPLPGLDPQESNFPFMARQAGIMYTDLINQILNLALERENANTKK